LDVHLDLDVVLWEEANVALALALPPAIVGLAVGHTDDRVVGERELGRGVGREREQRACKVRVLGLFSAVLQAETRSN